ncbi:kinase-like protein [Schizopora paradoxa]|uniref:Kinase-like protein n=1 Tax=Schizopora paradoxa TaxID=27342 RepID=A0A0H2RQM4_9AGAM|nr:kinase-like protein [Schizopora paradoxa]
MPGALKIPVIFTGPPELLSPNADNGSFGRVCAVQLAYPKKFSTLTTDRDGILQEATWEVQKVAVKQILYLGNLPEYRQCARVVREARIWNKMRHKNIVPLFGLWNDFSKESPFPAFISPWFDEGNLKSFLDKNEATSKGQRLSFKKNHCIPASLVHNHEYEVVHRDLRADNVLVQNFTAYVADFGISRIDDKTKGFSTQPMNQNPRYIAPERIFNPSEDDDALKPTVESDIYEFGSVFLEIWTGKFPWNEERIAAKIYLKRHKHETPRRPSSMDDHMWSFIQQCWARDRHSRPLAKDCLDVVVKLKNKIVE